jgi:hypothetical protein
MTKEIVIKSIDSFLKFPIHLCIDTEKTCDLYTTLCILRNNLIENGIVRSEWRHRLCFYKKIEGKMIKIKEGDRFDGIIYMNIENEIDYSEPVNILYYLEKRIAEFERQFQDLYQMVTCDLKKFIELKKIWFKFREENNDCFDYAEWFFVMDPLKEIKLLRKMSLDVRKWLIQKDKIISELNFLYLNSIIIKEGDNDFDIIEKYIIN